MARGFGLLSVLLSLIVIGGLAAVGLEIMNRTQQHVGLSHRIAHAAIQATTYTRATLDWAQDQKQSLPATKPARCPATADLIAAGHLPIDFNDALFVGTRLRGCALKPGKQVNVVVTDTGTDQMGVVARYGLPHNTDGLAQVKRRIAEAVSRAGTPAGWVPPGVQAVQGYGGFTKDLANFITAPVGPALAVMAGFEDLDAAIASGSASAVASMSPYSLADISRGLDANNLGFTLSIDFTGTGPYQGSEGRITSDTGVVFTITGDSTGTGLALKTLCQTDRNTVVLPLGFSVFNPVRYHRFTYEARCSASATASAVPRSQAARTGLGWWAVMNERSCDHPTNGAYTCIHVTTTAISISNIDLDGFTLYTSTQSHSKFRNQIRTRWNHLNTQPFETRDTNSGSSASEQRYHWELL